MMQFSVTASSEVRFDVGVNKMSECALKQVKDYLLMSFRNVCVHVKTFFPPAEFQDDADG